MTSYPASIGTSDETSIQLLGHDPPRTCSGNVSLPNSHLDLIQVLVVRGLDRDCPGVRTAPGTSLCTMAST